MDLPACRRGTEEVAALRRRLPAEAVPPALYGCRGLVDVVTVHRVLGGGGKPKGDPPRRRPGYS
jgi:hypothetical protein